MAASREKVSGHNPAVPLRLHRLVTEFFSVRVYRVSRRHLCLEHSFSRPSLYRPKKLNNNRPGSETDAGWILFGVLPFFSERRNHRTTRTKNRFSQSHDSPWSYLFDPAWFTAAGAGWMFHAVSPEPFFFFPTTANKAKGKQTRNKKKTPRAGCGHFFYSCHKSDAAPRVLSSNTRNWENNEASLVKLEWHRTIVPWITRLGTSIVDNCQQIKVATAYTAINHSFQM